MQDVFKKRTQVLSPPQLLPGVAQPASPPPNAGVGAYGLGVRLDVFHAGVCPPAAYGFGVLLDAFQAGV